VLVAIVFASSKPPAALKKARKSIAVKIVQAIRMPAAAMKAANVAVIDQKNRIGQ